MRWHRSDKNSGRDEVRPAEGIGDGGEGREVRGLSTEEAADDLRRIRVWHRRLSPLAWYCSFGAWAVLGCHPGTLRPSVEMSLMAAWFLPAACERALRRAVSRRIARTLARIRAGEQTGALVEPLLTACSTMGGPRYWRGDVTEMVAETLRALRAPEAETLSADLRATLRSMPFGLVMQESTAGSLLQIASLEALGLARDPASVPAARWVAESASDPKVRAAAVRTPAAA